MPKEVERLTQQYLNEPERIELNREQRAPQSLDHYFQHVGRQRLDVLVDYIEANDVKQGIIFCNSRDRASELLNSLQKRVRSLEIIHGGLDCSNVTHVINYDFPFNSETYTHRTGRAGRMGRQGTAITFVSDRDLVDLKRLFQSSPIEAHWIGDQPDLESVRGKGKGRRGNDRGGQRSKRPRRGRGSRGKKTTAGN